MGLRCSFRLQALCAAPRYFPVMWQWSRTVTHQGLAKHMTVRHVRMRLVVPAGHPHRPWVGQHLLDPALLPLQRFQEVLCSTGASVFHRGLCLPIAPHHNVAVAACFMVLCFLGITFCGVLLGPLYFGGESLEVSIDDVRGWELLVVVLEGKLVIILFRHLYLDCSLADTLALWHVGLQQVLPGVAMEALFTEMFTACVLALVIQQSIKVSDPCVVKLACHFNQQEVDPRHFPWLLAEPVDDYALIQSKDIDG